MQTTSKELMFGILQQRHQNIHPCSPLLKIQRAKKHLKFSMPLKKEKALTNRILDQKTKHLQLRILTVEIDQMFV